MKKNGKEFFELVRRYFAYLIKEYGFVIVSEKYDSKSFGECETLLESNNCRVKIRFDDREETVSIDIGPSYKSPTFKAINGPTYWYDDITIVKFLKGKKNTRNFAPSDAFEKPKPIEQQMGYLAETIRSYWPEIIKLMNSERLIDLQKFANGHVSLKPVKK